MKELFDIEFIISKLKQKRKIFVSEADFQLEMAWVIKEEYPNAIVRLEYCPSFDFGMHIDILAIINGQWIPIELKYKTKGCTKVINNEIFNLKNHGAKDVNCYLYLKDIMRIEKIKNCVKDCFKEGYAVFITNELSYMKKPFKNDCIYKDFSLENGTYKAGKMDWSEKAGEGTKKNCEKPIVLEGSYNIKWQEYSLIDNTASGKFIYLVNRIEK